MSGQNALRRVLVTGGAGFVGTNIADRLLRDGAEVVVLDDLSRPGVEQNLTYLRAEHPQLTFVHGDVADPSTVRLALRDCTHVFHLAAQVAVTTSVLEPRHDFAVNLGGTINVLEEIRRLANPPSLLFTSTNKVYGGLEDVEIVAAEGRYSPAQPDLRAHGIAEDRPLDFCSPYGCSKGGADQYVLDYAQTYGLRTVVFRMSCIYGRHQQGNEDQGWVAHFVRQALAGAPITIYGDGRQVRDVLFADDLVEAFLRATTHIDRLNGRAFNIGGGPQNTLSLLELLEHVEKLTRRPVDVSFDAWRVGDQRWYVSDPRRFSAATGWAPSVGVTEGVSQLFRWLCASDRVIAEAL